MLRTNFDLSIIKIPNTIMQVFLGHHAVAWAHANRSHIRYLRISVATCESKSRAIRHFRESRFADLLQGIHC